MPAARASLPAEFAKNGRALPSPGAAMARKRTSLRAMEPACVLGCGMGGVEELCRQLDDRMVAWALLRFQVGGGTFVRTKLVLIHFNGANTPALQRGLLNARGYEVLEKLGEVHCTIEVTSCKELSVEYLCERLLRLFAADNMDYSLQALRQDYSRMVAETEEAARRHADEVALAAASAAKAEAEAEAAKAAAEQLRQDEELKRHATLLHHNISLEEALQGVSADQGNYNWLLLDAARLSLHKAGQGGFDEMKDHLADDRVLFGLLRLTFGTSGVSQAGRAVRGIVKYVFVHWVGPRVSIVRRGVWNARSGEVGALIGKWCAVNFRREAHGLADLQLDDIILELRRLTVVDGVAAADGVAASRISVEEYRLAIAEEARQRAAEERLKKRTEQPKQDKERGKWGLELLEEPKEEVVEDKTLTDDQVSLEQKAALPDIRSAVQEVRGVAGRFNWVLCGWQQPAAFMPPSPCRALR